MLARSGSVARVNSRKFSAFALPALPWAKDALSPHISPETIDFHYGKHHQTYVTKLNGLVEGTDMAKQSLEELIMTTSGGVFNNAAQVWNHTFYWNCLAPNAGGPATGKIGEMIVEKWGSFDAFKGEFETCAVNAFGSAWAWLVQNADGSLEIVATSNAANPMTDGKKPLLTCDVWEHAYYIDYRNVRPNYLAAYWKLVNWDHVNSCLAK